MAKNSQIIFNANFHHQGGIDPKAMGTIESVSLRHFFWPLAKSDQTYGYGDIKCWGNSRGGAAGGGAAARGVQYDSKVLIYKTL